MTSIAKLKDKARKHEQKEDWQAAIEVYQRVLDQQEEDEDAELDLGLYNRIGDLNLRLGETDEAVSYYETAADKYAESGFYNNAIALCNKALRHRPDRPAIYLKLSRLCTEQGFQTDARRWILEYAERQVEAGAVEEALTGLEEFAQLSDDPEVRELLAQQLAAHDRHDEAIEQLRNAYGMRVQAGQMDAAAAVAEKAQAIDPSVDLEAEAPAAPEPEAPAEFGAEEAAGEPEEFEVEATAVEETEAPEADVADMEAELEPTAEAETEPAEVGGEGLEGLETRTETVAEEEVEAEAEVGGLEGFETTGGGPGDEETAAEEVSGLEVGFSEQEPQASPEDAEADQMGGLETFDTGEEEAVEEAEPAEVAPEAEPEEAEEAEEAEEDAEPLPLLDSDFEDEVEEGEEEAEPLPTLDTGFEEEEAGELAAEAEAPEPSAETAEPAGGELDLGSFEDAEAAEAQTEEVEAGEGDMDLSLGETAEAEPAAPAEAAAGADEDSMDLGSFDLGFESSEEEAPAVAVEDLDVEAILDRARQQVSRGLTGEALRELNLLAGSDAGPEVFRDALTVVNEIIRHDENDVSALQRRVEYAARIGDRELMVDAYLDLAETLDRLGAETKARVMYERALDLDPENEVAREAVGVEDGEEETVDLDAILREMEPEELEAAGSGERSESDPNFAAMLNQFKAKVTENVDADEAGDHYDLGLAFKEMGLIDEAIAEFQTALTGGEERLKVYEELGQCFVQKGQLNVALKVFNRALKVPHADDDDLLGVYYHLGQIHEELGQREDAREAYEKILSIDESFADVPDRVARL